MGVHIFKRIFVFAFVALIAFGIAEHAQAQLNLDDLVGENTQNDLSDISENLVETSSRLPGLITALSYLLAILFGVTGVLKLKEHVENPGQVALRVSLARFFIGGALLALPVVYEAMINSINGGSITEFSGGILDIGNSISAVSGFAASILGGIGINEDFNFILSSIITSVRFVPGLIAAVAYLLGLLFGVIGLLKIKEHIENPEQNNLKEGVIRLLVGGALFALPTVYDAMQASIIGNNGSLNVGGVLGILDDVAGFLNNERSCNSIQGGINATLGGAGDLIDSLTGDGGAGPSEGSGLGQIMCNVVLHTGAFSAFLTAISYLFGLVLGLWGILKIKEHVINPQQTDIWQGVSRLIAAGAFFSLPFVTQVFQNTVVNESIAASIGNGLSAITNAVGLFSDIFGSGGGEDSATACSGLDKAFACFVSDISGPLRVVITTFATFAGIVLIMVGISRLMKSAQEGARGPGGIGTIMTFLTGGALISFNQILATFSTSFFNSSQERTKANLGYAEGLVGKEHAELVFTSILQFMILIGLISFVRGIFIIRGVAEGNQQSSLMAGITHMAGGSLAVNLGPLLNAVQTTLGINALGVQFTA